MNKEMFNLEAMDRKLGCVMKSSKSRLKKKNQTPTNCTSLGKTQATIPNKPSNHQSPTIDSFIKRPCVKRRPKSRLNSPSQTDRQSKSILVISERFQLLSEQLQNALQDKSALQSTLSKLLTQKSHLQTQQTRLSEQVKSLTQSQSTVVNLNESLSNKLASLQQQYEDLSKKTSEKERMYVEKMEGLKRELEGERKRVEGVLKRVGEEGEQANGSLVRLQEELEAVRKNYGRIKMEKERGEREVQDLKKVVEESSEEIVKKRCSELEIKNRELNKALNAQKEKAIILETDLKEESQAKEKYQQRNKQLQTEKIQIEESIKERNLRQIDNLQANYKQAIKKAEQNCKKRIKQVQQLSAGALQVKQKQIDLIKASASSEIQKVNVQMTQINLIKNEKESIIKSLEKKVSDLTAELKSNSKRSEQFQESSIQQRLKIQQMQVQISKLNRLLLDSKQNIERFKSDKNCIDSFIRQKDETIEQLQQQNQQLERQCNQLVEKLEDFCSKVQALESHMQSEQSAKRILQSKIKQLQIRMSCGHMDPNSEQQMNNIKTQNQQLKRSTKQHKVRLKISEDKVKELEGLLEQTHQRMKSYKTEIQKLAAQSQKSKLLSQQVESSNRISQINLKSLLRNLQDKEELAMTLKDQLVKQRFRNDMLVTQLKTMKQNHRVACSNQRCLKTNTPVLQQVIKQKLNSSRRSESIFRTIDTNATFQPNYDHHFQKMTI